MSRKILFRLFAMMAVMMMLAACGGSGADPDSDGDDLPDDGCPEGSTLDNEGFCVYPCGNDADCPAGEFCNTDLDICQGSPFVQDGDDDLDQPVQTDGDIITGDDDKPQIDGDLDSDLVWETDIEHDAINPWIQVEPRSIDFGAVPIGGSVPKKVTITNIGEARLDISDIYLLQDSDEFDLAKPDTPLALFARDQVEVNLVYEPIDDEAETNMLIISSNDPAEPNVGIPIYTEIKESARLRIDPDPIDFGLVRLRNTTQAVQLINDSGVDIVVTRIVLAEGTADVFSLADIVPPSVASPLVIPPHGTKQFGVVISPEDFGVYEGALEIDSDDAEDPNRQVPIRAEVCEPEIVAEPESFDFAGVAVGLSEEKSVVIRNEGCYPLELESITMGPATTADYEFITRPADGTTLGENEEATITVRYTPDNEGVDVGSAVVENNDADEAHLILPFGGDPTPPDIAVDPEALHFRAVAEGEGSIIKTVTVRNEAAGGLLILHDFVIETTGTIFYKASFPIDQLGPGQSTTIKIGYQPDDTEPDEGILRIFSNDPDPEEAELVVPLTGDGISNNECPVADAGEDQQVEPLQTIRLDGSGSSDPDGTVEGYLWEVIDKPAGSRSIPLPLNTVDPSFFFDLAGEYTLQLQVRDNENAWSCLPDTVTYTAIPGERIHIQLIWNTNNTDVDVHLVREGGQVWDGFDHGQNYPVTFTDCFFSTCKQEAEPNGNPVDWDSCGHPSLDIDDKNGYGPENINLNDPCNGDYTVYVHYWNAFDVGATTATVRIYIMGQLRHSEEIVMEAEHFLYDVAAIRWMQEDGVVIDHPTEALPDTHGQ